MIVRTNQEQQEKGAQVEVEAEVKIEIEIEKEAVATNIKVDEAKIDMLQGMILPKESIRDPEVSVHKYIGFENA